MDTYANNVYRSCSSHCCVNHGCKYGHAECPVKTGAIEQEYLCEDCTWRLDKADVYEMNMPSVSVSVGYARGDGSIVGLPSEAVVNEAVRQALMGLEVAPGWTVKIVLE